MPGQQLRFDPSKPFGEGAGSAPDGRIQEGLRRQSGRDRPGPSGPVPLSCLMPSARHALDDVGRDVRVHRHAGDHLHWPTPNFAGFSPMAPLARRTSEPTYQGYSIGKWIDEDGDGVYDVLEVETRGPFKGPRTYDASGFRCISTTSRPSRNAFSGQKEPEHLHDVITVFDHALTRPWTADKNFGATQQKYPNWDRVSCAEGNSYVTIGKEYYMVTADGYLMPTTKDQKPPDPKYFSQAQK